MEINAQWLPPSTEGLSEGYGGNTHIIILFIIIIIVIIINIIIIIIIKVRLGFVCSALLRILYFCSSVLCHKLCLCLVFQFLTCFEIVIYVSQIGLECVAKYINFGCGVFPNSQRGIGGAKLEFIGLSTNFPAQRMA